MNAHWQLAGNDDQQAQLAPMSVFTLSQSPPTTKIPINDLAAVCKWYSLAPLISHNDIGPARERTRHQVFTPYSSGHPRQSLGF
jgi:hypothetical protein